MNWLNKLKEKLWKLWEDFKNDTKPTPNPTPDPKPDPTPDPTTDPTTDPTENTLPAGAIKPSQVKWLGPNFTNAKTTIVITSAKVSGKHLEFKLNKKIPWPKVGPKNCDGIGFLIRKIKGEYVGGKVEWCVSPRGWYDIKTNVEEHYNGSTMPKSGETVWCGIGHSTNTSECTTLNPVVWP